MPAGISCSMGCPCCSSVVAVHTIVAPCRFEVRTADGLFALCCVGEAPSRFLAGCRAAGGDVVLFVRGGSRNTAGETEGVGGRIFLKFSKNILFCCVCGRKGYLCHIRREIKLQFYEIACNNLQGNGNTVDGNCFLGEKKIYIVVEVIFVIW